MRKIIKRYRIIDDLIDDPKRIIEVVWSDGKQQTAEADRGKGVAGVVDTLIRMINVRLEEK